MRIELLRQVAGPLTCDNAASMGQNVIVSLQVASDVYSKIRTMSDQVWESNIPLRSILAGNVIRGQAW